MFVTVSLVLSRPGCLRRHVACDLVEAFPGDLLGAVEDRLPGGVADEPEQAADQAPGAAVQVVRENDEAAVLVPVEPQGSFECGDEGGPFLAGG